MLRAVKTAFKRHFILDKQRLSESESWSTLLPIPVLFMVTVLGLTVGAAVLSQLSLSETRNQSIEKRVSEDGIKVRSRLDTYAQLLQSGVGLVGAAPIDSASWHRFVDTFDMTHNFPAVYSFGVLRDLRADQVASFEEEKSADYGRPIVVSPPSDRARVGVVEYAEPQAATATDTVGFDAFSQAERKTSIDRATASNSVLLSNRLELSQDPTTHVADAQPAYAMYAPVYAPGSLVETPDLRQAAISRHVFLAFKTQVFFERIFKDSDYSNVGLKIYAQTAEDKNLIYSSGNNAGKTGGTVSQEKQLYGQTLVFRYSFDGARLLSTSETFAPYSILIIGALLAALLFTLTILSLRSRQRRSLLARDQGIKVAQDELLSLASHQLRTPATGVKQYLGMVLQGFAGDITEQQQSFLQKAYASNERQLHVINDILYLAKIDAGRIILAKTDFDLVKLLKEVIEEQAVDAEQVGLKIIYKGLRKANINADEHMLRMVIENLLSNALKYTNDKGRVLVVAKKLKGQYLVEVTDNGVGIAEQDHQLLFRQFSRIPNPRSQTVSGTGVGLYLARHLTLLHDGDIEVISQLGKGSTFTVRLPQPLPEDTSTK